MTRALAATALRLKHFPALSQEIAHDLASGAPGCQGDAKPGYFFLGGLAGFWFGSATTVAE